MNDLFGHASSTLSGVVVWRAILAAVSLFNLGAWAMAVASLSGRKASTTPPEVLAVRRRQIVLSALFVVGCAFRAILPRADVQRICLHDSFLSSVMVGRSVATIAELAFVAQCALLLRGVAKGSGARFLVIASHLLVPMIGVAEIASWYAVLTTNYLGNIIEESIWALTSGLAVVGFVVMWARTPRQGRRFLSKAILVGAAYFTFMCTVDVPGYVSRWSHDQRDGRQYLTLVQGVQDSAQRRVVTHDWTEWRDEIPWMTLYFSVGVWISIALTRAPTSSASYASRTARSADRARSQSSAASSAQ